MTNTQLTFHPLDISSISKFAVGFESMFDELTRTKALQLNTNYPPYNLIKHTDDKFTIELAVAGFSQEDVSLILDRNILNIKGEQQSTHDSESKTEYLHRGISARTFSRSFTLADYVEIVDATLLNGILIIELERNVPQAAKPKTFAIRSKT